MELNINEPGKRITLGIADRGSVVAKCNKCEKNLMIFQLTKTNEELVGENKNPITTRIAVYCENCKNINRVISIKGQFYPGAANDQTKFEIDENIQHGGGLSPDCDVIFKVNRRK
jgi:ssDNA-binding Zn-finger/Zn-ribbon topoisomerase 1